MDKSKLQRFFAGFRKLSPKKEDPVVIRWAKEFLVYFIVPMLIIYIIIGIVQMTDHRTSQEKWAAQFEGLMLSEPCVKLDSEPVTITLEWSDNGASFKAPKSYSFTGARFTEPTIYISQSDFQGAKVFGDHVFIPVRAKRRIGYSPQIADTSVFVSIPKQLVPSGITIGPGDKTQSSPD